jgi:hypothetical protein
VRNVFVIAARRARQLAGDAAAVPGRTQQPGSRPVQAALTAIAAWSQAAVSEAAGAQAQAMVEAVVQAAWLLHCEWWLPAVAPSKLCHHLTGPCTLCRLCRSVPACACDIVAAGAALQRHPTRTLIGGSCLTTSAPLCCWTSGATSGLLRCAQTRDRVAAQVSISPPASCVQPPMEWREHIQCCLERRYSPTNAAVACHILLQACRLALAPGSAGFQGWLSCLQELGEAAAQLTQGHVLEEQPPAVRDLRAVGAGYSGCLTSDMTDPGLHPLAHSTATSSLDKLEAMTQGHAGFEEVIQDLIATAAATDVALHQAAGYQASAP